MKQQSKSNEKHYKITFTTHFRSFSIEVFNFMHFSMVFSRTPLFFTIYINDIANSLCRLYLRV